MRALPFYLTIIAAFAAAMLVGWTQARVATVQIDLTRAAGGADLYANNPFVKGAK
jgi:hypothetical protein